MRCKRCGDESNNGTNFCTRKCRIAWIRKHNIRGAKKYYSNPDNNPVFRQFGMTSSALDKDSTGHKFENAD